MHIRCPVCDYAREINPDRIPPTAEFATCPKCRHRFRFRALDLDEIERRAEPPAPDPRHADVWDAVDSLPERWQEADEETESRGSQAESEGDGQAPGIPWEHPEWLGYGKSLLRTALWALLQPRTFFASITNKPALVPPLLFYLVFSIINHATYLLWLYLMRDTMAAMTVETLGEGNFLKLLEAYLQPLNLLLFPFMAALHMFVATAILTVSARAAGSPRADFALSFRVLAYSSAAYILSLVPVVGVLLGSFGYLVLMVCGCRAAFRLNAGKAFLVILPLLFFSLVFAQTSIR